MRFPVVGGFYEKINCEQKWERHEGSLKVPLEKLPCRKKYQANSEYYNEYGNRFLHSGCMTASLSESYLFARD